MYNKCVNEDPKERGLEFKTRINYYLLLPVLPYCFVIFSKLNTKPATLRTTLIKKRVTFYRRISRYPKVIYFVIESEDTVEKFEIKI